MRRTVQTKVPPGRSTRRTSPTRLWSSWVDSAIHSSMCAKTASTEASGSGSGSRTSCTVVVTRSSTRPAQAAARR